MKHCVLLSMLLALGCVHGAPVEQGAMEEGSCKDATALATADLALNEINRDLKEGYIFSLLHLSNVHMSKHGETGVVFYLTLDVVETNCSVLSKKAWKDCEARDFDDTPEYGQCKATIYVDKPQRVVRLYKYNCVVRRVPVTKVVETCPDCSAHVSFDHDEIQKTVSSSLEKFNKENGLANYFALLNVTRATSGYAMSNYYHVEYTIQETTCAKSTEAVTADKCPIMECEFAHKGFCKASHYHSPTGESTIDVDCEIYEPEASETEKKLHLLGGETDHSHNDTHTHDKDSDHDKAHDHAHAADQTHTHDHAHDHTKSHAHHDKTHKHADNSDHHHSHDHDDGSTYSHAHAHSHDHGHGHDHVHAHHAKAHNHGDHSPNHHHDYKHADGTHTHEHDHELALDHDHKHAHLHEHEHHHHHHGHDHETTAHHEPEGTVSRVPPMDQPMTLPSFPDNPVGDHDHSVAGQTGPTILHFPSSVSAECPVVAPAPETTMMEKFFSQDPMFKAVA